MSFLGSIFGGGGNQQAYDPVTAKTIMADPNQMQQQQNVVGQQQQLAGTLQQQAAGQGPSVANQQLIQTLQQQQAAAAASAAGARGINPALAQRTAMETQAQNSQAAAQSGAIARAQETLNAQGQLGGVLQGIGSQNLQQQKMGLEAQQANQTADLQAQAATRSAGQAQNKAQGDIFGGIAGAVGQGLMALADGGSVPAIAPVPIPAAGAHSGPSSILGKILGGSAPASGGTKAPLSDSQSLGQGIGRLFHSMAAPGNPGAQISSGLQSNGLTPAAANAVVSANGYAKGGNVGSKLKGGGKVPGKAQKAGNSYANDTVKAVLSPGEGVIDRETMGHPGPVGDAARFVMAYVNHKKRAGA